MDGLSDRSKSKMIDDLDNAITATRGLYLANFHRFHGSDKDYIESFMHFASGISSMTTKTDEFIDDDDTDDNDNFKDEDEDDEKIMKRLQCGLGGSGWCIPSESPGIGFLMVLFKLNPRLILVLVIMCIYRDTNGSYHLRDQILRSRSGNVGCDAK